MKHLVSTEVFVQSMDLSFYIEEWLGSTIATIDKIHMYPFEDRKTWMVPPYNWAVYLV